MPEIALLKDQLAREQAARTQAESDLLECRRDLDRCLQERQQRSEELRDSEERFREAFEFAAIGMALVSPDGHWLRVNRSICELVGYSEEELLATDFQSITHPGDLDSDLAHVHQMLRGEIPYYEMEKRYIRKSGELIWILLSVSLVRDRHGMPEYFISQIQDINDRKRAEITIQDYRIVLDEKMMELERVNEELEMRATTDGLTGLLNHRAFHERLISEYAGAARHGEPLSIIMIDVDHFKRYNDTYGHPDGDILLRHVGHVLKNTVRLTDVAARYGGEEFAIILPKTEADAAMIIAERIRDNVETIDIGKKSHITVSQGVASFSTGSKDRRTSLAADASHTPDHHTRLLTEADRALYASKKDGRNRVTHADRLPERSRTLD